MRAMPTSDPDSPVSRAEAIFLAFARAIERGEYADFDALCRAHPDLDGELRAMRSQSQPTAPRKDASPSDSDLSRRLRTQAPDSRRYQIVGEVARGGMGAILKVWDDILRRTLAMKVVLGGASASAPRNATPVEQKVLDRAASAARVSTRDVSTPGDRYNFLGLRPARLIAP
jgi:hypothetical protein